MSERRYRFADSSKPGLLMGLSLREALPWAVAMSWVAIGQLLSIPLVVSWAGLPVAAVLTFWRPGGQPASQLLLPAGRAGWRKATKTEVWHRESLVGAGAGYDNEVPALMVGLELLEVPAVWSTAGGVAVIHDTKAGRLTAMVRVRGQGFTLAAGEEQDAMVAAWGAALSPFAAEGCPVARVTWHEWAHSLGTEAHQEFLTEVGLPSRPSALAESYTRFVDAQARSSVSHDAIVAITVDLARVRARRTMERLDAGIEALVDELGRLSDRLTNSGMTVEAPMNPAEVTSTVRTWSDPRRSREVETLSRSLAAAVGRGTVEWGPMALRPDWHQVWVDGSVHRTWRVANWPMLPVGADFLQPLLNASNVTRTVTVVMEPVPTRKAAGVAEREVSTRESDAEERARQGFHLKAKDRKRLREAQGREEELVEGHAEFQFLGLVSCTADGLDALDDAAAQIEQAAAQSLVDLRPLHGRHDLGWLASLPLGRGVGPVPRI